MASQNGHKEVLDILLDAKADPNISDNNASLHSTMQGNVKI